MSLLEAPPETIEDALDDLRGLIVFAKSGHERLIEGGSRELLDNCVANLNRSILDVYEAVRHALAADSRATIPPDAHRALGLGRRVVASDLVDAGYVGHALHSICGIGQNSAEVSDDLRRAWSDLAVAYLDSVGICAEVRTSRVSERLDDLLLANARADAAGFNRVPVLAALVEPLPLGRPSVAETRLCPRQLEEGTEVGDLLNRAARAYCLLYGEA